MNLTTEQLTKYVNLVDKIYTTAPDDVDINVEHLIAVLHCGEGLTNAEDIAHILENSKYPTGRDFDYLVKLTKVWIDLGEMNLEQYIPVNYEK